MDTKEVKLESDDSIELDKEKILKEINYNGKFEEPGILIRKWDGEDHSNLFLGHIRKEKINYMGILSGRLQREGFGMTNFMNGERYFGMFSGNLRNRHGWYEWPSHVSKENPNIINKEFYYGLWRDNKKHDHGVFLWLSEPKDSFPFGNYDNADFHAYIGLLAHDCFTKGTYLIKKNDDYFLYYGYFDEHGKKFGDTCYFYNSTEDQLIFGKMNNDQFLSGYLAQFDAEQGEISDLLQCEFTYEGGKAIISSFKQKDEVPMEQRKAVSEDMTLFRNIILGKDYFGDIYQRFKKTNDFIDENMNNLDVLDSQEKFPEIMQISVEYNNLSIFQDLEKMLSSKTGRSIVNEVNATN